MTTPHSEGGWTDEDIGYLLSHSADILWHLDTSFTFTHVSTADNNIWGYTREEILRMNIANILTPESMVKVGEMNRQRLMAEARGELTGTVWVQAVVVAKDGTRCWAEVTSTPMRDESGAITGYIGVTRDITPRVRAEELLAEERRKLAENVAVQTEAVRRLNEAVAELDASKKELAESERRYRLIVDRSPIGLAVHREGRFLYLNPAAVALFGAKDSFDLLGRPIIDRVHPDFRGQVLERTRAVAESGNNAPMLDEKFLRLDGSTVEVRVSGAPLDYGGAPANLAIIEDISGKVRAEAILAEKTAELDNFFNLALDLLCIADTTGRFIRLNPSWEKTLGYSLAELTGKRFIDFVHPEDVATTNEASARLAAGGEVIDFTNRYRCRDGSYRYIEWRSAPYKDKLIYAAARDVTERREMENRLAESEGHLKALVAASPMGMHQYRLTEDGRLVFTGANPAADRILGVDNSNFVGLTLEEAFPPLAGTPIPGIYRRAAETGEQWTDEQLVYNDGVIAGAYQVFAFRTSPGRMAVMFLDITERKRAERERQRLEEDLLQAQKMEAIGRLAGGVAHDFNNLLTAIIGYCDLAHLCHGEEAARFTEFDSIRSAADKAASLTQQLLAFSRKQILQPKVINPADVVIDAQKMLGRLLGEDVQLTVRIAGDTGFILADPGQMTQVIMNLAINARDAMPKGGTLSIETKNSMILPGSPLSAQWCVTGPHVLLSVADTGVGMDEETRARIFEPFFTTKELGKGTGLGLATVHGIVTQSGGCISVESREGQGTRFDIHLPRVSPPEAVEPEVEGKEALKVGTETILLAEDNADVRNLTNATLKALGYRVVATDSGEDALKAAENHEGKIDLLLTDVVMPGISGLALAEAMRKRLPNLPIVYMSGYAEDAIVNHGVLEEGTLFLQKPFSPHLLAELVRKALDA